MEELRSAQAGGDSSRDAGGGAPPRCAGRSAQRRPGGLVQAGQLLREHGGCRGGRRCLEPEAQEGAEQEGESQAAGAAQGGRPVRIAQVSVTAGHGPRQADAVHVRGHAFAGTGLGHRGVPQEGVHCRHGARVSGWPGSPGLHASCGTHDGVTTPVSVPPGPSPLLPHQHRLTECPLRARDSGDRTGTPRWRGRCVLPKVTGLEAAPTPGLLPSLCPLTCFQGVQRGLAHGFVDIAGGDGDTPGHPGGLVTGVAPQGHHWVRSDKGRVRQARLLPSPLSCRHRFEWDDTTQGPDAHGPEL